jgi:ubiquinone/menaquinone biosynthesis C-methylase UbiE
MSQDLLKKNVRDFWDTEPCGTDRATFPEGSLEYFEEIENYRYRVESCIHSFAQFTRWHGKKILEVGCGCGTDLMQFARAGAEVHAVDLSPHSAEIARRRLNLYGFKGEIKEADAEHLPFPDNYFDLVYSWGVIHHTPDTPAAVREIFRVLKPGGKARVMIYNRYSWIGLKLYIRWGLLTGRIFTPFSRIISGHFESPGTKAYTVKEAKRLFSVFSTLKVQSILTYYDFAKAKGVFPPSWLVRLLGDNRGWFMLISGEKQV